MNTILLLNYDWLIFFIGTIGLIWIITILLKTIRSIRKKFNDPDERTIQMQLLEHDIILQKIENKIRFQKEKDGDE